MLEVKFTKDNSKLI
jgi:hypothetical protein